MLIKTKPYLNNNLQHFDWRATETMQRDKEQSHLLHEPKFRIMTTDPISGLDVEDYNESLFPFGWQYDCLF